MAGNFLKSLKEDFAKKAIYDIIKYVIILAFSVGSFALFSKILVLNIDFLKPFSSELIVIISTLGGFFCLILYDKYNRFRPKFPSMDFDFLIVENEISYEYIDKTHMIYKKKKQIKALKNGLDSYKDRYRWTGMGNIIIKSGVATQKVVETIKKNVWHCYEIILQKTLKKGDIIETEVIWELEDIAKKAVPFVSTTIEEPTEGLKFCLTLPPDLGVREVTCEISSSICSKKPFDSFIKPLDKHGEVVWHIENPALLYNYEMRWNI